MNRPLRLGLALFLASTAAACLEPPPGPAVTADKEKTAMSAPEKKPTVAKATQGELVTYKNGEEIGREKWADDGVTLKSDISLGGAKATITVSRKDRKVKVESGGATIDRDIPAGAVALENGSWQAYAVAAEGFASASEATPVKVLLPAQDVVVDAKIKVRKEGEKRFIDVSVAKLQVTIELDADGRVVHAAVPSQEIEVRRADAGAPKRVGHQRPAPAIVTEELVEKKRGNVTLRGSLWLPKANAKGPLPVALVIAGSGPTDRDGNSPLGVACDTYRLLAEALAAKGIATLRYDKRGVGESSLAFDVAAMTVDDSVADAAALLPVIRDPARFSKVSLIGHSEGGLIATMLAGTERVDGLVLVSAGGRPLRAIVHEQLASKVDAATLAEADRLLGDVATGKPLERVPNGLEALFNPIVAAYLKSEMDVDPAARLKALKMPTVVVQGETDAQVSVEDAKLLGKARPGIKVTLLPGVNHLLKAEAARSLPQASYTDPSKPIAPAAVDAIAAGVVR